MPEPTEREPNRTLQSMGATGGGTGAAIVVMLLIEYNLPGFYSLIDTDAEKLAVGGFTIWLFSRAWSIWGHLLTPAGRDDGFAVPAVLGALLLASLLLLAGCEGTPRRAAEASFVATEDVIAAFQVAAARKYLECDANARSAADEQRCFVAKDRQADQIDQAIAAFNAYGLALIAIETVPEGGSALQQARAILARLMPELRGYVDPTYSQAVAWVEGDL